MKDWEYIQGKVNIAKLASGRCATNQALWNARRNGLMDQMVIVR